MRVSFISMLFGLTLMSVGCYKDLSRQVESPHGTVATTTFHDNYLTGDSKSTVSLVHPAQFSGVEPAPSAVAGPAPSSCAIQWGQCPYGPYGYGMSYGYSPAVPR